MTAVPAVPDPRAALCMTLRCGGIERFACAKHTSEAGFLASA